MCRSEGSELCQYCGYVDCLLSDGQSTMCEKVCKVHYVFECPECYKSASQQSQEKRESKKPYGHLNRYSSGGKGVLIL